VKKKFWLQKIGEKAAGEPVKELKRRDAVGRADENSEAESGKAGF
jgi:hypothetical protein